MIPPDMRNPSPDVPLRAPGVEFAIGGGEAARLKLREPRPIGASRSDTILFSRDDLTTAASALAGEIFAGAGPMVLTRPSPDRWNACEREALSGQ